MSTYGEAIYGVDEFSSNILPLQGITKLYVGCELSNGKEANGVFDELQLFFEEKSDADIESLFYASTASTYTTAHQLLAHFDSNLDGGNLAVDGVQVAYWRIYRKKSTETQYKLIATIANDESKEYSETVDYEPANLTNYDYAIEGVSTDGIVTNKYEVTNQQLEFRGFWLVDKVTGNTFNFKFNRNDTNINIETDRTEVKTFSRFPIVVRGDAKYKRGNLECAKTTTPLQELRELEQFEGSNDLLLKLDSGESMPVDIYNLGYTLLTETDNEYGTVKCEYVQVGEVV